MSKLLKSLSADVDCVKLDNSAQITVKRVRNAMSSIGIIMPDSDIVNAIIRAFSDKQPYVSILPLSQKVKLSLPEVEKLLGMGKAEKNAFDFLVRECHTNPELKSKVNILRLEVQITGEVTRVGDSHLILDELHDDLEFLFMRKYRNVAFRAGYKKLIIKSSIASAIYGEYHDDGEQEASSTC